MKKLVKDKFGFFLLILNIILFALSIGYFSYSLLLLQRIETLLRLCIIAFFVLIAIVCVVFIIKSIFKRKKLKIVFITLFTLVFALGISFVAYNINKIYSAIANITSNSQTYSSSLVVRANSDINSIDDISDKKIGILSDSESVDGYQIPQEIIKDNNLTNEIVNYSNYLDLINDLIDEKIDVIFLPTNYSILFVNVDGFEKLGDTTKIIFTKDKNVKVQKTLSNKSLTEPFSVLLMGVDSEKEEIKGSSFNGDSLVLITFNPKNLNATILSIPRDTYTSISCFAGQRKNKITHAAWYGESCMINTIENMFDISIDYYVKINFSGVVNIVDALGGVDVDVPYSFCEQNSKRMFGNSTVYVSKGFQTLNGEQALALSRNRHPWTQYCSREWTNYNSSDFVRGQNQQKVIQAMANKIKNINSVDTFYSMLDSISQSMETNMSTENILSFYNIAKDMLIKSNNSSTELSDLIGFERLYLSGYDQTIVDYDSINNTGSQLALYNFVPYQGSINDISRAMKINLGIMSDDIVKNYDFDVNNEYEEEVIGKGRYDEAGIAILPSFVGKDVSNVSSYCSARGINLNIEKVSTISSSFDGMVITQSLPSGMDVAYVSKSKGLTVSVYEYNKKDEVIPGLPTDKDKKKDDDKKTNDDDSDTNNNSDDNSLNNNSSDNSNNNSNNNSSDNSNNNSNNNSGNDNSSGNDNNIIPDIPSDEKTTQE